MQHALFPPTRTEVSVTSTIAQRTYSGFELQVTTKSSVYCTIYLLNEKDEVQKFVLSCDPGTEFRLFLPYVFRETGLVSTIDLKAKHLRGVTSLVSKNLLEADEMTLQMRLAYSRVHHGPQYWDLNFIWTNASVSDVLFWQKTRFLLWTVLSLIWNQEGTDIPKCHTSEK